MRKNFFTLRLTDEERADLQQKADSEKLTAGGFIRWLIKKFKAQKREK